MQHTGKSLSEAPFFGSTNPQYDERLFIELQVQCMKIPSSEYGENMFCKKKSFWQRFTCTKTLDAKPLAEVETLEIVEDLANTTYLII